MPLDAIVVPVPSREHEKLELTALTPAQSLVLLSQFPRIPGWIDRAGLSRQFTLLGALVARVPAYVAVIPWGPPFVVETGQQLVNALRRSQPPLTTFARSPLPRDILPDQTAINWQRDDPLARQLRSATDLQ